MLVEALSNSFSLKASTTVKRGAGFNSLLSYLGANPSGNVTVNQHTALTLSAFYNGINIICNDFAKLPKGVYQKSKDGKTRSSLFNHPVKYLIDKKPNQYQTAFMFDFVMIQAAILKGNGYAIIERNGYTSTPEALQFVDQDKTPVQVYKYSSQLYYKINDVVYAAEDIIHVPGFSFNGITGIGVIQQAARSLGVSLASENFAQEYYEDKGVGIGVVTVSKSMEEDAKARYGKAISDMFATKSKWRIPVIDEASNFEHVKVTPQEAQFLVTNEHGINEVARWLNINPVKLKHLKDANNSISENLQIEHVSDSLLPWAIKFQQEYETKLFTSKELQSGLYIKFNTESLLSADKKTQADYWSKMILAGVYTRNEVRSMLDYNPLDGLDEPLTPVNTQNKEQIDANLAEKKAKTNE